MPKISIVIPTYNCHEYIEQSVLSALSQRYKDKEVLVIDDGSTDNTKNILAPYITRGEIRYIYQANAGPGTARNNGIRNATGQFVTLLDSDDTLCDGCIEAIAGLLESNPEIDFLFTNYDIFDENGVVNASGVDTWKVFRTIPYHEVGDDNWIFLEPLCKYVIRHGGFMHTSGTTIRLTTLDEIGYFKEGYFYGEDDELFARATYRSTSGYIDRVLSRKRNHSNSIIHDQSKDLRNNLHYLALTEIQLEYYSDDKELLAIIHNKLCKLAYDCSWALQSHGRLDEAQQMILRYIVKCRPWPFIKLLLKNYLIKLHLSRAHA